MDILWDKTKDKKLKLERGISFEDVAQSILDGKYLSVLENPGHSDQMIFVVRFKRSTYAVPFVIDGNDNIVLKTIYPSRKFHRMYGKGQS